MTNQASFGRWLSARRHLLDLTQDELAQRVGCSVVTIRKLESDERRPSKQIATRLADSLGITETERTAFLTFARSEPQAGVAILPLPTALPASAVAPTHRTALPTPLTALIGRDQDLAAIHNRLLHDTTRLLTLIGAPGIGKTRLALAVAAQAQAAFADGVAFVMLAPISDPELVIGAIAQTLQVKESAAQPLLATLQAYLANHELLLILDNCEQVLAAAPQVAELLAACPRVTVLATSRAALHVRGEQLYPVPPLLLPNVTQVPDTAALAQTPAVALFVERAQAVQPTFCLSLANANDVAEICTRLDGLPLAIELVAARVRLLPPAALLARLDDRLALLIDGPRDLPPRHRTLRSAIAWSYGLLDAGEQMLFRRLGVFVGSWTLEAAEAVCTGDRDMPVDVLEGLAALLDQSLLRQEGSAEDAPRFTMLETIREYAREQLEHSGEIMVVQLRHAAYYKALAELAQLHLHGPTQQAWLTRLELEHDNMRAALGWTLRGGDEELGAHLTCALGEFWVRHGYVHEGRRWLDEVLGRKITIPTIRAKALHQNGLLALAQGNRPLGRQLLEESLAISREAGDKHTMALALQGLGRVASGFGGDFARAGSVFEESLGLFRELDDLWGQQLVLRNLGELVWLRGDHSRAGVLFDESLALARKIGDNLSIAYSTENLGRLARSQGDYERAVALLSECLAIYQALGDKHYVAWVFWSLGHLARSQGNDSVAADNYATCLALAETLGDQILVASVRHNQAYLALHQGDHVRAEALLIDSLTISHDYNLKDQIAWDLAGLGGVALAKEQPEQAVQLLSAAEALFDASGHVLEPTERDEHDRYIAAARSQLGDATFAAAWEAGRAMTLEQAIAYALDISKA